VDLGRRRVQRKNGVDRPGGESVDVAHGVARAVVGARGGRRGPLNRGGEGEGQTGGFFEIVGRRVGQRRGGPRRSARMGPHCRDGVDGIRKIRKHFAA